MYLFEQLIIMDRCDSSEDEYEEIDEEMLDIHCLFCDVNSASFEKIFAHIKEQHQLDFVVTCKSLGLGTFHFIKLINYIRKQNVDPAKVEEIITSKLYDHDEFMKPTLEDDHLIMFGKVQIFAEELSATNYFYLYRL